MMFGSGLLLATCFIPGVTGAMIPTQWAVLSILLPLGLWRQATFGPGHCLLAGALAWAAFSTIWSPSSFDAGFALWIMSLWALAFYLGTTGFDPTDVIKGLALGLTVSSAIAIAQSFGYAPVKAVETATSAVPGLFYNPTVLGATAVLILIACMQAGLYRYIPGLLPGLYLAHSRGAWFTLAIVSLARLDRRLAFGALFIGGVYFAAWPSPSDMQRLLIWFVTWHNLSFLGHGLGSYASFAYYNSHEIYVHSIGLFTPGYAHNDFLQLWFELGIGSLPIFALLAIALTRINSAYWPLMVAFATLGLFYFPLFTPISAAIGCFAAGRCITEWHHSRLLGFFGRFDRLLWHPTPQRLSDRPRREPIPVAPTT